MANGKVGRPKDKPGEEMPAGHRMPSATKKKRNYRPKVICGAKLKAKGGNNKVCQKPAGWGTNHPGTARCKYHGGASPTGIMAAASKDANVLMGRPLNINPLDALIMCIQIRAGEVKWLSDRMAELDKESWLQDTMVGKQFHVYSRERQHAMSDLARFSQMAISLGIAERAVKLAEMYGETIAKLLNGILNELRPHMSEEGIAAIPIVVRRHLLAIEGGKEASEVTQAEISPPGSGNYERKKAS